MRCCSKWDRLPACHLSLRSCRRQAKNLPHSVTCLLLLSTLAFAQRNLKDIPAPDPQAELASFKAADGYEVKLWAADPLLAKPTQIAFDRKGRLWASTSET